MSEPITITNTAKILRIRLLTTACGLALLAAQGATAEARAQDIDRPLIWIELGGQVERMADNQEIFDPSFLGQFDRLGFGSMLPLQRPLQYSNGADAGISFQPADSHWIFSAFLRYGRSNGDHAHYQRLPVITTWRVLPVSPRNQTEQWIQYAPYNINAKTTNTERHAIADFEVGRDVGIGMFGKQSSSVVSGGVRFVRLTSGTTTNLDGVPDFWYAGNDFKYNGGIAQSHHRYIGSLDAERDFQGIGPSLSWKASAPILRSGSDTDISLDWGVNVAALFGRQKVRGTEDVIGYHYSSMHYVNTHKGKNINIRNHVASSYNHPVDLTRSRSVVVPNVGGFAGVSWRYSDAKVSLGYRADFFFNAIDGGIDTRKNENRGFYGPYASISIGLGD